ncbi:MAG: S26 family signal peptidase [Thermoplasmata archaeon]|nr:S26 family signal peptidase [Thermoplasmata archaeon]
MEEGEEEEEYGGWLHRPRLPVFFRALDTWWFEPLVALAVVALLLVSLFAYTQNWPPVYVVVSSSMQHGTTDELGLINTGDFVLAEKLGPGQIIPYLAGVASNYRTYGEFGDVLLYHPNGSPTGLPVIHRVLAYVEANPNGSYTIPALAGLPCGSASGALYRASSEPGGCGSTALRGSLTLLNIGWRQATVNLTLATLGPLSGFLTMGDNNLIAGTTTGVPDQPAISSLVEPDWVIGAARGMIPWFGALILLVNGMAGEVPSQSWEWMGITLIGLFLAAIGTHFALRAEGIEDDRRKALEREEAGEDEEDEDDSESRWRGFLRRGRPDDDDEDAEDDLGGRRGSGRRFLERLRPARAWGRERSGGRPQPKVGRSGRSRLHRSVRRSRDLDDEDEL